MDSLAITLGRNSLFIPPNEEELPKGCQTYSLNLVHHVQQDKSNPFFSRGIAT